MLKLLRKIIQEINVTDNIKMALQLMVERITSVNTIDACSLFLLDEVMNEYVLVASKGGNPKQIGKLRFKLGESLIGLVGERGEPMNIADSQAHERNVVTFKNNFESLHAFLGAPIVHQRELLGVIVLQHQEIGEFGEEEEAFLVTLAAQLANPIANAKAKGNLIDLNKHKRLLKQTTFTGVPGAPGIGIGKAVVVFPPADLEAVPDRLAEDKKTELKFFTKALQSAREDLKKVSDSLSPNLSKAERELFNAYLKILDSNTINNEIKQKINEGLWAQAAVKHVIKRHIAQFESMDDHYLQERASDFKDLGQRILFHLQSGEKIKREYPKQTILVGEEVTPSVLAEVPESQLVGVVSATGSANSHIAILARALGLPTVMGASGIPITQLEGREIILDGYYGEIYVSPSREVRTEFKRLLEEERELDEELTTLRDLPAETKDGFGISLYVNTGLAADVRRSLTVGAEGVGLYRTEVPFMVRDRFPTEEEQRILYRQLLNAFVPRPVMMRTLDVGGDKSLPYFPVEEDNPFLGWRGIRITLDHPEIFLVQIRAMLRANAELGNLHVMLPMVSSVNEIEEATKLLNQAVNELKEEGLKINRPPLGVMLEVPSAIYLTREFAKRVDFLSVGSNDLTQYLLAVDRNNNRVATLYNVLHPAILRALLIAVKDAHKERKHISICGEMAGDPVAVVLLLAIGFDTLSMSATRLPRIKWVIRNFTMESAKILLEEVLVMDDPVEIRGHMEAALDKAGLGGLIRAGR